MRKLKNNLRLWCENSSFLFNFSRTFAMLINLSLIMWLAICLFFFFILQHIFFCTRLCARNAYCSLGDMMIRETMKCIWEFLIALRIRILNFKREFLLPQETFRAHNFWIFYPAFERHCGFRNRAIRKKYSWKIFSGIRKLNWHWESAQNSSFIY